MLTRWLSRFRIRFYVRKKLFFAICPAIYLAKSKKFVLKSVNKTKQLVGMPMTNKENISLGIPLGRSIYHSIHENISLRTLEDLKQKYISETNISKP